MIAITVFFSPVVLNCLSKKVYLDSFPSQQGRQSTPVIIASPGSGAIIVNSKYLQGSSLLKSDVDLIAVS